MQSDVKQNKAGPVKEGLCGESILGKLGHKHKHKTPQNKPKKVVLLLLSESKLHC